MKPRHKSILKKFTFGATMLLTSCVLAHADTGTTPDTTLTAVYSNFAGSVSMIDKAVMTVTALSGTVLVISGLLELRKKAEMMGQGGTQASAHVKLAVGVALLMVTFLIKAFSTQMGATGTGESGADTVNGFSPMPGITTT